MRKIDIVGDRMKQKERDSRKEKGRGRDIWGNEKERERQKGGRKKKREIIGQRNREIVGERK